MITEGPLPASIAAMYQEGLLAHHRAPHNKRELPDASVRATRKNPVCGDEITVMAIVDERGVQAASFTGRGCSIATASASMMTDAVAGLPLSDVLALTELLERSMSTGRESVTVEPLPEALAPLRGVVPFAGRHSCALLPWQALRDALELRAR